MSLLEATGLTKSFGGVRAVDGLDLHLAEGEVLGLIGPNGAGKTTLFNLLAGTLFPDQGRIALEGQAMTRWPAWRRARAGIIRTFQHGRTFANLSVTDNLLLGSYRRRGIFDLFRDRPSDSEAVRALLAPFGDRLLPRSADPAWKFSYANRRRIELARALAARPRVLLLDEPTAGMNPVETKEILAFLQDLKAQGQTMIVIEHKLPLILPLADRVLVLDNGVALAEGPPLDIPRDPRVIAAYLGTREGGARG